MYDIHWVLPNGHMAASHPPPPSPNPRLSSFCRQLTVSFAQEMLANFHPNGQDMMGLMKINGTPGVNEVIVASVGGGVDGQGGREGVEGVE